MRASGLEVDLDQTGVWEGLNRRVMRDARLAAGNHGPAIVRGGVAINGCINGSTAGVRVALYDGQINLLNGAFFERALEFGVGELTFGHCHEPAGSHIKAMDDALALGRPTCGNSISSRGQTPHNCGAGPARARVGCYSHWLVDNDHILIVIDDGQTRYRLSRLGAKG